MRASPVWVQVYLSGVRWGVVCGAFVGWLYAFSALVGIDGAPDGLGGALSYVLLAILWSAIPGVILGLLVGTVVGVGAGLLLQRMLSRTTPGWAVLTTFAAVIGLQECAIGVVADDVVTAAICLVLPAIEFTPLLRTLRRVARDAEAYSIHHDTLAA